jgi:hypothetical protein
MKGISDANVLIRSDNTGVIGAFGKGHGKNVEVNSSIRRAQVVLAARNISLCTEYVNTKVNLADAISRAEFGPEELEFHPVFKMPDELKDFVAQYNGVQ